MEESARSEKWHTFTKHFPKEGFAGYSTHSNSKLMFVGKSLLLDPYPGFLFYFRHGCNTDNPEGKKWILNIKLIQN